MAKSKKPLLVSLRPKATPEQVRAWRRLSAHVVAALLLIAACGFGLHWLKSHVQRKMVAQATPPKVVIKNTPHWMSPLLAERIVTHAQPLTVHSPFDQRLLEETAMILRSDPWVREVKQIRRVYGNAPGDTLEIDCEFRTPVALVHWGEYYWLVDEEGVKLPEAFTAQEVPRIALGRDNRLKIRIIEGVLQPPPRSGHTWNGKDLLAGIEMLKLLADKPYAHEIVKVEVSNFEGRLDRKEAHLVLITRYGSEIRWGRPISSRDLFVEVPPAQKLAYLEAVYEQTGRIDGRHPWIDIRFDAVTYPAHATALGMRR